MAMLRLRSAALLLLAVAAAGCDDDPVQDIAAPLTGARVKFFNFGLNAPGVNFYANDTKVTGISSTSCATLATADPTCLTTGIEATTGTAYGAAAVAGFYAAVAPGQYTLSGRIAAVADRNLPIATVSTALENGKAYSFFVSGIYDAVGKKSDAFVIEDAIPAAFEYSKAYVRFVNAIPNSQPMALVLRLSTGSEIPVGSAVAYKNATAFIDLGGFGVADLLIRASGGTTNLITRTGVSFVGGRVYTVTARGDMTATTGAGLPALDVTANR